MSYDRRTAERFFEDRVLPPRPLRRDWFDLRISRFQPCSNRIGWFIARAGGFTQGIPKSSQQTEAVNPEKLIANAATHSECLDLMHRLMAYRHEDFWQCVDTVRELRILESLWACGKPPWKRW